MKNTYKPSGIIILAALMIFSLAIIACDNGSTSYGGFNNNEGNEPNGTAKVLKINNISSIDEICMVLFYPPATTRKAVKADANTLLGNKSLGQGSMLQAFSKSNDAFGYTAKNGTATYTLYGADGKKPYTGTGSGYVWLMLYDENEDEFHFVKSKAVVSFSGQTTTMNASTDFSDSEPNPDTIIPDTITPNTNSKILKITNTSAIDEIIAVMIYPAGTTYDTALADVTALLNYTKGDPLPNYHFNAISASAEELGYTMISGTASFPLYSLTEMTFSGGNYYVWLMLYDENDAEDEIYFCKSKEIISFSGQTTTLNANTDFLEVDPNDAEVDPGDAGPKTLAITGISYDHDIYYVLLYTPGITYSVVWADADKLLYPETGEKYVYFKAYSGTGNDFSYSIENGTAIYPLFDLENKPFTNSDSYEVWLACVSFNTNLYGDPYLLKRGAVSFSESTTYLPLSGFYEVYY